MSAADRPSTWLPAGTSQSQVIAIVAEYRRKGEDAEWVAFHLGLSYPRVRGIYEHLQWVDSL